MTPVRTLVFAVGVLANATVMGADVRPATQIPQVREDVTVRGLRQGTEIDYYFTFNTPVALPGVGLGSGTYLFRRVTPETIQVLSANRDRAYAMVHTIPIVRSEITDRNQVVFGEAAFSGAPRPMKAWFLPGRMIGQELVYPKWQTDGNREVRIAK